jgi:hypothetical protein
LKILLFMEVEEKSCPEICIKFGGVYSFWNGQVEFYLQELRFLVAGTVLLRGAPQCGPTAIVGLWKMRPNSRA